MRALAKGAGNRPAIGTELQRYAAACLTMSPQTKTTFEALVPAHVAGAAPSALPPRCQCGP